MASIVNNVKRVCIRVEDSLWRELKLSSIEEDKSMSRIIIEAIEEYLNHRQQTSKPANQIKISLMSLRKRLIMCIVCLILMLFQGGTMRLSS